MVAVGRDRLGRLDDLEQQRGLKPPAIGDRHQDVAAVAVGGEPLHGAEEGIAMLANVERDVRKRVAQDVGAVAVAGHRPRGEEHGGHIATVEPRVPEHGTEDVGLVPVARHRGRGCDHPTERGVASEHRQPGPRRGGLRRGRLGRRVQAQAHSARTAAVRAHPRKGGHPDGFLIRARAAQCGDREDGGEREGAGRAGAAHAEAAAGCRAVEDGQQPALELRPAGHGQGGHRPAGDAVRAHDVEEVVGVDARAGAQLEHGVVAGPLALVAEALDGDPHQRVEPVQHQGEVGDPLGQRVPAPHVGQLVREHHDAPLVVPRLRVRRQPDDGLEHAPGHRHRAAVSLQQGHAAPEAQPARDGEGGVQPAGVGHHRGATRQPPDAEQPGREAQQHQPGADGPDQRKHAVPVDPRHSRFHVVARAAGRDGACLALVGPELQLDQRFGVGRCGRRRGEERGHRVHLPRREDSAEHGQHQHAGEGERPDEVTGGRRAAPHRPGHRERREKDDGRLERPRQQQLDHCPSLRARSMMPANRSSSAGESFSCSTSVLTTCSALPPKNVRTTWLSAEVRARSRGTVGA